MPFADKEIQKQYLKEYKKRKRQERGSIPLGRKSNTEEQKLVSKAVRSEWEKTWRKEYFQEKPEKRLLWAAKKRSKERGLSFDLEESDIVIPTHCPYLGIPLSTNVARGTPRTNCMSLDRMNNELGYVKGNVEVISHLANTMKSNANPEQLISFAQEILKRHQTS